MSTLFDQIQDKARPSWPVHRQAVVRVRHALLASDPQANRDPETAITDALTDLRHLCDRLKLDFALLDRRAYGYYTSERKSPTTGAK